MGELSPKATRPVAPVDLILESNHRVANNLGALASTLRRKVRTLETGSAMIPREEFAQCLDEVTGKIIAVARLHRSFAEYAVTGDHDVHEILANVLRDIENSGIYGDRLRIGSLSPAHPYRIGATRAFSLTLAFAEIVSNAVKHAHPAGLPIEISIASHAMLDGGLLLRVCDDGVGLPEGFVESRDAGMGLRLIRSLIESTDATLDVKSDSLGLTYSMRFAANLAED